MTEQTDIEIFKIKKMIKHLDNARGNATSMISLILPPNDQISKINQVLTNEYGAATNIKSRVNRLSVLGAITSTKERLKRYSQVPKNGLVIFCGTFLAEDGKEKLITVDFEPFKPINTSLYYCDNKFHTESLHELLQDDNIYGFIIMDGNGTLFATLQGNTQHIITKLTVNLPRKHGRGGQSAPRFQRLREEARNHYVRKIGELTTKIFITNDKPNITGLVLAGSAQFKNVLNESDWFDMRLKPIVVTTVDIAYGGEVGLNEAIILASDSLGNIKFLEEKKIINKFFEEIATDSEKYCCGIKDVMTSLDSGAVEILIVWENLEINRIVVKNNEQSKVLFLTDEQETDNTFFTDETGIRLDVIEKQNIVEWFTEHYKEFGTNLQLVTDKSQEGIQFVRGFGGIGAILRWPINFTELEDFEEIDDDDEHFI